VAYSKICTHAGCAVAMLRYPLFEAHSASPALVCPCHYSTFDVATGGTVLFGPAGRPLPQLPIAIARDGTLRAAGSLSGDVGPAWFGINRG
jgi:ubiquinol-cytochrome c reductase iron-sulfur subunit